MISIKNCNLRDVDFSKQDEIDCVEDAITTANPEFSIPEFADSEGNDWGVIDTYLREYLEFRFAFSLISYGEPYGSEVLENISSPTKNSDITNIKLKIGMYWENKEHCFEICGSYKIYDAVDPKLGQLFGAVFVIDPFHIKCDLI